jgi:hypothetical protein
MTTWPSFLTPMIVVPCQPGNSECDIWWLHLNKTYMGRSGAGFNPAWRYDLF